MTATDRDDSGTLRAITQEWLRAIAGIRIFDAIRVKIRDEGFVRNKAVYIALGIQPDGTKEVLGIWIEQTEGAKFWLRVMNELKNRGVTDILIGVVDGLKGFPEAINAVFPETGRATKARMPMTIQNSSRRSPATGPAARKPRSSAAHPPS